MKIKFIGTGSGQTSLKRFHSSLLIQKNEYKLLIDTGDSAARALMNSGEDVNTISAILFTHMHPDHSAGLPSFIVQLKMIKRKKELIIYSHSEHKKQLTEILINTHIYPERLEFPLTFRVYNPGEDFYAGEGITFRAELNVHLKELEENPAGISPVSCSFLFNMDDKNLFYTGDIGDEGDLYKFSNERIDIIIAESTHVPLEKLGKAYKALNAEFLYLTHIADDMEIPAVFLNDKIIAVTDGYEIYI
jgi:ribonuclease BN (tRNA processing enzyme)